MAEKPEQIDRLFSVSDIKICPDLAHLAAGGGDPLEIVKKYYDRISFVHLKDLDENGFAPLGTGHVDVEGVLRFLKEKGYAGDYLVEADGFARRPGRSPALDIVPFPARQADLKFLPSAASVNGARRRRAS